ncbi:hypothetical protein GJ496_007319 [Pomphorhynchus laevis]|nr:hypothetical protein GJ496_007319 [Pomphorhynchus laevis]
MIAHLMRRIPSHVVTGFLQSFDIELVHAFKAVTAVQLNRHAQQQFETRDFVGYEVALEQIAGLYPQELQHMGMVSQSRLSSMIDKEARRNLIEQVNKFDRACLLAVSN